MLNLSIENEKELEVVINRIKEKGHDKLHKNRGTMANRISISVYDMLKNKEDYKNNFDLIGKHIYGL